MHAHAASATLTTPGLAPTPGVPAVGVVRRTVDLVERLFDRECRGFTPAERRRARRLMVLLSFAAMLGLADLIFTLTYMTGPGMIEMNPIARAMIDIGSTGQLVVFKLLTIVVSCGALYFGRRYVETEAAAWGCIIVLLALMLHWLNYNAGVPEITHELAILYQNPSSEGWVRIDR